MEERMILALGFFDGVHLGHQALLRECCGLARREGCKPASITFDRHPQSLFTADPPELLSTEQERKMLLARYGMAAVYTYPVTVETMSTPWEQFLEGLVARGAAGFVSGADFRFGHKGQGDVEKLRQFCQQRNLPCVIVPEQTMDGIRISSTHIRSLLAKGHMGSAAKFLGHPHILSGKVVEGRKLGNKLGFPTANVEIPEGVTCPRHGVYACKALVNGEPFLAVTNVGSRPTVAGHQVRTESWILDFQGDLYGKTITLEFHYFLRPEKRFASVEKLTEAVKADAARTRDYFREKLKNASLS